MGDDNDRKTLEDLGVLYQAAAGIEPDADLTIIGGQTRYNEADVRNCLVRGGNVLFLSRSASNHGSGVKLEQTQSARGSIDVPAWPECRGLSPSDLHWRTQQQAWLVASGVEKGADGLLGVLRNGKGVAVFCQIEIPSAFKSSGSSISASRAGGKRGPWRRSWRTSAQASQRTVMPSG